MLVPRGTAHPRAYGENCRVEFTGEVYGGSSPRIRGKSGPDLPGSDSLGLIPAHTGKM